MSRLLLPAIFAGILLGVSGCAGSNFQVKNKDQYRVMAISAIEEKQDLWTTKEEYYPEWITANEIPNICEGNKHCFIISRVPAGRAIRDKHGVHPDIMEDKKLIGLGYIPHNISLDGTQTYILVKIPPKAR